MLSWRVACLRTCILRTTRIASFSDQTAAKLLPTIVKGIAVNSTPQMIANDVMIWPMDVSGYRSP